MLYALQRQDDPYLDIIRQYGNDAEQGEREADLFAAAFTKLQRGMAATNADLLGVIYESFGHASDAFGQYFTPHNVCEMMAGMNIADIESKNQYSREKPLTVADPACGSGRLLIHAARQIPDTVEYAVFYGQDKDVTCAKMAALNLCLFNMDGYVVHGDSLHVEQRRAWQITSTLLGGSIRELDSDEIEDVPATEADDESTATLRQVTVADYTDTE